MNQHLNNTQLLNLQFDLCSESQSQRFRGHLAGCAECRARAAQLERKFATLESLRQPVEAPERLIADTLRAVRLDTPASARHAAWWGWAAGLAAVAMLTIVTVTTRESLEMTQVASAPKGIMRDRTERPAQIEIGFLDEAPVKEEPIHVAEIELPQPPAPEPASELPNPMEFAETQAQSEPTPRAEEQVLLAKVAKRMAPADMVFSAAPPNASGAARDQAQISQPAARQMAKPSALGWTVISPPFVAVQVMPALVDGDKLQREMKKDTSAQAHQWNVSLSNAANETATVTLQQGLATTNWTLSVIDESVTTHAAGPFTPAMTVQLLPHGMKMFVCTLIVEADEATRQPEKGAVP